MLNLSKPVAVGLSSLLLKHDIQDAVEVAGYTLATLRTEEFTHATFVEACMNLANLPHDVLVVDINTCNEDAILKGLQAYRMKRTTRVIVIGLGRQAGDNLCNSLTQLWISDFVCPPDTKRRDDEPYEALVFELRDTLKRPQHFSDASRWQLSTQRKTETVTIKEYVGTCEIAFVGTEPSIGCSHQVLLLASTLAQKGYSVAIVELTTRKKFSDSLGVLEDAEGRGHQIHNIDFYCERNNRYDILKIKKKGYHYLIYDLGGLVQSMPWGVEVDNFKLGFFLNANVQVVVGGVIPWNSKAWTQTFGSLQESKLEELSLKIKCLLNHASEKDKQAFLKHIEKTKYKFALQVYRAPTDTDLFQPSESSQEMIHDAFMDVLPTVSKPQKKWFGLF